MHLAHTGGSVMRHADLDIGLVQQRAQRPAVAATQGDHGHVPLMGGLHGLQQGWLVAADGDDQQQISCLPQGTHLARQHATPGQEVRRGEILGEAGRTGNASCTHLHYEVRRNGTPTNPRAYLP